MAKIKFEDLIKWLKEKENESYEEQLKDDRLKWDEKPTPIDGQLHEFYSKNPNEKLYDDPFIKGSYWDSSYRNWQEVAKRIRTVQKKQPSNSVEQIINEEYERLIKRLVNYETKAKGFSPENVGIYVVEKSHNYKELGDTLQKLAILHEAKGKFKISGKLTSQKAQAWDKFVVKQNTKLFKYQNLFLPYKDDFYEKKQGSVNVLKNYKKDEDRTNAILIAAGIAGIGLLFVLPVNWWIVVGSFVVFAIVSVLIASQIGGNGDAQMMTFLVLIVLSLGGSFFLGYVGHSTDFSSSNYSSSSSSASKSEYEKNLRKAAEDLYDKCQLYGKSYDSRC